MSSFEINLWCYPWDLVDEGIDRVLDRLQGEAGVTGVSVATHYHAVDQLRPHGSVAPRRFRSAGGAQFQPEAAAYAATRYRPVVAQWLRKSNPLAAIAEGCVKRGLTIRAWQVCLRSEATAGRYGAAAVKDLFGDASPRELCASNPDVRELMRAMAADLSEHYPLEAIELERLGFAEGARVFCGQKAGFSCGPMGDWLRGLCFCESCRQLSARDGVDVPAAAAATRRHLEHLFCTGTPLAIPAEQFLADEPALAALVEWRSRQVTSLAEMVRSACRCRLVVYRDGDRLWSGADYGALSAHCDALLAVYDGSDPGGLDAVVELAAGEVGGVDRVELGLSACAPPLSDSAGLVALVKRAVEVGVRSINVYQYGLIPENRLEWVRQAGRYARRES